MLLHHAYACVNVNRNELRIEGRPEDGRKAGRQEQESRRERRSRLVLLICSIL
jgi:hypothetical protein